MNRRSMVPFVLGIIGVVLLFSSFIAAIDGALDAGGAGAGAWIGAFFAALVIVIVAVVMSIINLIRKRDAVISVATLFVCGMPLAMVAIFAVAAVGARA